MAQIKSQHRGTIDYIVSTVKKATGVEAYQQKHYVLNGVLQVAFPIISEGVERVSHNERPLFGYSWVGVVLTVLLDVGVSAYVGTMIITQPELLAEVVGAKVLYNGGISMLADGASVLKSKLVSQKT